MPSTAFRRSDELPDDDATPATCGPTDHGRTPLHPPVVGSGDGRLYSTEHLAARPQA